MAIRINDNSSNFVGQVSVTIDSFTGGLAGTVTSPSSTIDGNLQRALGDFRANFRDTKGFRFYPQRSMQYAISGQADVLDTYGSWTARKDLTIFQALNWDTGGTDQTNAANRIRNLKSTYGDYALYVVYSIHNWAKDDANNHRTLQYDLMSDNSALDTWACHDDSGNVLYGEKDQTDSILANTSDVCPTVGGINYNEAYVDRLYSRLALGTDMTDNVIDGTYADGTDNRNAFPQPHSSSSAGPDYNGVPDYDYDGIVSDNTQADYRRGMAEWADLCRSKALTAWTTPAACGVTRNGGRDPFEFGEGTEDFANHEWYQEWEGSVLENVMNQFNTSGFSGGDLTFQFNNIYDRLMGNVLRGAAINHIFCKPSASNNFGHPFGYIDIEVGGFTGMTINDFSQAERDWASFWYALCMLDTKFCYGGLVNKRQPSPPPDEWFYDIGSYLTGSSLDTFDMTSLANDGTFTVRAADDSVDGNWFFRQFANGYFYVNLPELNSAAGTTYSSLGSTTNATSNYPTTPVGKVARRLNAATYTSALSGESPFNYNSSRNDGSLAYNGSNELVDGQWRGGLVIWADS